MADSRNILTTSFLSLRSSLSAFVAKFVPPNEVEDVVQETYVRICQVKNTEDSIRSPKSFLYRTARNLALDHLKKAHTRLVSSVDDIEDFSGADTQTDEVYESVASNAEFVRFCEAVRLLPQQCRRAFVLKKIYGYSQREIAREMGISENTVEKHIALGIKRSTYYMTHLERDDSAGKHPSNKSRKDKSGRSKQGQGS